MSKTTYCTVVYRCVWKSSRVVLWWSSARLCPDVKESSCRIQLDKLVPGYLWHSQCSQPVPHVIWLHLASDSWHLTADIQLQSKSACKAEDEVSCHLAWPEPPAPPSLLPPESWSARPGPPGEALGAGHQEPGADEGAEDAWGGEGVPRGRLPGQGGWQGGGGGQEEQEQEHARLCNLIVKNCYFVYKCISLRKVLWIIIASGLKCFRSINVLQRPILL